MISQYCLKKFLQWRRRMLRRLICATAIIIILYLLLSFEFDKFRMSRHCMCIKLHVLKPAKVGNFIYNHVWQNGVTVRIMLDLEILVIRSIKS